jgi:N-acetylglucosamine-6-phosphate deacetylase
MLANQVHMLMSYELRSSATLMECVNNFLHWSGASIPQALKAVTLTPSKMLGIEGVKGCLDPDADADLVILSEERVGKKTELVVDQVWKFGAKVYEKDEMLN